jgi:hypothetical protein
MPMSALGRKQTFSLVYFSVDSGHFTFRVTCIAELIPMLGKLSGITFKKKFKSNLSICFICIYFIGMVFALIF